MKPLYKGCKDLHAALRAQGDAFVILSGPDGQRWIDCSQCDAIGLVPANVVAVTCDDCCAPCECGLRRYEHKGACAPEMGP